MSLAFLLLRSLHVYVLIALVCSVGNEIGVNAMMGKTTRWQFSNPDCLGKPLQELYWDPITPDSNNCSRVFFDDGSASRIWISSQFQCPSTPYDSFPSSLFLDNNCTGRPYVLPDIYVGACIPISGNVNSTDSAQEETQKRSLDQSYFLSCQDDPPTFPYVQITISNCSQPQTPFSLEPPVPSNVTQTRAQNALGNAEEPHKNVILPAFHGEKGETRDVDMEERRNHEFVFSNTPNTCVPLYPTKNDRNSDEDATENVTRVYVQIPELCDALTTTSLDVAYFFDSNCTHLHGNATYHVGHGICNPVPGYEVGVTIICFSDIYPIFAPNAPAPPEEQSPTITEPTTMPTTQAPGANLQPVTTSAALLSSALPLPLIITTILALIFAQLQ